MYKNFITYLKESIPFKSLYITHFLLAGLIILQIINSNFLHMTHSGEIKGGPISEIFLWVHIVLGLLCIPLVLIMVVLMIKKQSLRHFFPYLFNDNKALFDNIKEIFLGKLPTLKDKGLANVVQGLGIAATFLILAFGVLWLILWKVNPEFANNIREIHKSLTGLIEVYLYAHGGMAILHFVIIKKNQVSKREAAK